METLSEGSYEAVTEIVVQNNLNKTQEFSWDFETGEENVTSTNIDILNDNLFVFIQSNYSEEGVYRTTATINSSDYNDTKKGVVVS